MKKKTKDLAVKTAGAVGIGYLLLKTSGPVISYIRYVIPAKLSALFSKENPAEKT